LSKRAGSNIRTGLHKFYAKPGFWHPDSTPVLLRERENGGHRHSRWHSWLSKLDEQSRPGRRVFDRGYGSKFPCVPLGQRRRAERSWILAWGDFRKCNLDKRCRRNRRRVRFFERIPCIFLEKGRHDRSRESSR